MPKVNVKRQKRGCARRPQNLYRARFTPQSFAHAWSFLLRYWSSLVLSGIFAISFLPTTFCMISLSYFGNWDWWPYQAQLPVYTADGHCMSYVSLICTVILISLISKDSLPIFTAVTTSFYMSDCQCPSLPISLPVPVPAAVSLCISDSTFNLISLIYVQCFTVSVRCHCQSLPSDWLNDCQCPPLSTASSPISLSVSTAANNLMVCFLTWLPCPSLSIYTYPEFYCWSLPLSLSMFVLHLP